MHFIAAVTPLFENVPDLQSDIIDCHIFNLYNSFCLSPKGCSGLSFRVVFLFCASYTNIGFMPIWPRDIIIFSLSIWT